MTFTVEDFLTRIIDAFSSGDLSKPTTLGDALAHLNYLDSAGGEKFLKDCLHSLDGNALIELPIKPARHSDGLCKEPVANGTRRLFWVEDRETIFHDRHVSLTHKEWAIKFINDRLRTPASEPGALRRKIVWLSDLGDVAPAPGINAWQLCYDLGFFGKSVEEELWICRVVVSKLHKPTWVDAGFTFFWYAAPGACDCGKIRSLRDGKPRFKEWVAKRESVIVEDVEVFFTDTTAGGPILNVTDLFPDYLKNCADEVLSRRIEASGGVK